MVDVCIKQETKMNLGHSMLVACLAFASSLKMEVIISTSEMLVDFHWTAWCYIPEARTHNNHCCENIES
jgi:hypothetical protein